MAGNVSSVSIVQSIAAAVKDPSLLAKSTMRSNTNRSAKINTTEKLDSLFFKYFLLYI